MSVTRRALLAPLAALVATPLVVKGKDVGRVIKLDPEAKYVVFLNVDLIDYEEFASTCDTLPPNTPIYPVLARRGRTLDDAIRIFKV